MKRLLSLLAILLAVAGSLPFVRGQSAPLPASPKFVTVDIEIDPKGQPLAAYQLEFASETKGVTLVGITAGQHPAYAKTPPYYDPAALQHDRVILAAFTTDSTLPNKPTVVATLNLMLEGDVAGAANPHYAVKLEIAADAEGKPIGGATAKIVEGAQR